MIGVYGDPAPYTALSCKHFDAFTGHCKKGIVGDVLSKCSVYLTYCPSWVDNGTALSYRPFREDEEYRRDKKVFVSYDALSLLHDELLFDHDEFVEDQCQSIK